jgi:hypothetical protein
MSSFPRPAGITWLCVFAILAALYELTVAQLEYWDPEDPDTRLWIATHFTGARVQMGLTYLFATITLLTCYFIMRAKNWARWTYLSVSVGRYALAFILLAIEDAKQDLLYLRFRGAMMPGLLLLIMAFLVLFTRDARDFFIAAGRPLWRVQEEEDEREARRKK